MMTRVMPICLAVSIMLGTPAAMLGAENVPAEDFPQTGLLPKKEIGALRLLQKSPKTDGRGVVVAIFDTGVDPGAAGLQTTTDGKPKIIDIVDATGSGDVLMSKPQKPKGNTLTGLTGRTLNLNPKWTNPKGMYRLGVKAAYDLFPGALIARMKSERRKAFNAAQKKIELRLRQQLTLWDATHKSPSAKQKLERRELQARLNQLLAAGNTPDPGPVYDCVVYHDGKVWRAVVDTDEDGNLADEVALTNYRSERQFATFGQNSQLNFSVNIYENGGRLSIVSNSGAHATHVAGIVAAHYPKQPELNGVAPGAQIVSVKIGDSRLGSMETATGLVRGLRTVLENRCDLINMSYGEASSIPNHGRLISLFTEVVRKHGVIFVASAGNSGPALSTVGSPGGTTSDIIGVGAYVSPAMKAVEYTLRKKSPGLPYTWTSRGPTFDGHLGVDIFAPGGAIAPVPNWTLQKSMRMNGTSMASPNCCGGIALILSALKAKKAKYTPYSIRRALANTAKRIPDADIFAQGPGLLQVDAALEYLLKYQKATGEQLRFAVRVSRPGSRNSRGIYLRTAHEVAEPNVSRVSVRAIFPEKTSSREKTKFEMRISLVASEEWVHVGPHFLLTNGGAQFNVEVDSTALKPGAHFAEVLGIDALHPERGPLFRVPVTVIKPTPLDEDTPYQFKDDLKFQAGQIHRRFFVVPDGVEWAKITLRPQTADSQSRRFVFHTLKTRAGQSIDDVGERSFLTLNHGHTSSRKLAVRGGQIVEVCLAQYWSSLGESSVEMEIQFRGLTPDRRTVALNAGDTSTRVELTATTDRESVSPKGSLTTHRTFYRPKSSVIRMLNSQRDRLPNGQSVFELVLTYEFEQTSTGSVTPRFGRIDGFLYDSPFGGHLWMLFDSNKRRIATDDIWPAPVTLRKGHYTLKVRLRHSDRSKLEHQKSLLLSLDRPLKKPISLSMFPSKIAARDGSPRFSPRVLTRRERVPVIVSGPAISSLPASVMDGDVLLGTISYGQTPDDQRPEGYPVWFTAGGTGRSRKTSTATVTSIAGRNLAEKILNLKFQELEEIAKTGKRTKVFDQLTEELLKSGKQKQRVLRAQLILYDHPSFRKERLEQVVKAADALLATIDTEKLARHFGTRVIPGDSKAARLRKQMEKQRDLLTDTLYRKGRALGYMELPEVLEKNPLKNPKQHDKDFEDNFRELQKWVDTTDKKYVLLHVRRERRKQRYGLALEFLRKYDSPNSTNYFYHKKHRDIYEKLGWKHLAGYVSRSMIRRFPKDYLPF
ncbi:MAG: hypothetical protein Tsb009_07640 [Planctomycetaceae bacterium]